MQREGIDFTYYHIGIELQVGAWFTKDTPSSEWELEDIEIEDVDVGQMDDWVKVDGFVNGKPNYVSLLTYINDKAREEWAER